MKIGIPKGSLFKESVEILSEVGVPVDDLRDPQRQLIFKRDGYEFFIVRPTDIPTFVSMGGVDCAICGKDSIIESELEVMELVDLKFGYCRFVVAEPANLSLRADLPDSEAVEQANRDPQSTTHLIKEAIKHLKRGELAIFPTDTVYGIALSSEFPPDKIFAAKKRPPDKSIPWLVSSPAALDIYGTDLPDYARELAEEQWPGALTLVVKASNKVLKAYRGEDDTIALRMPASELCLELIRGIGCPLATTSANISGEEAARSLDKINPALLQEAAIILDAGLIKSGGASRIVRCTTDNPEVIR
jgi:tRNA threonylcarbamoyl adenosine modification protein (Sua5/YciO/YrdC/YwlC family)